MAEVVRFRFRLAGDFFTVMALEDPQALVGAEIPVTTPGGQRSSGRVTGVIASQDGVEVVMEVTIGDGEDELPVSLFQLPVGNLSPSPSAHLSQEPYL